MTTEELLKYITPRELILNDGGTLSTIDAEMRTECKRLKKAKRDPNVVWKFARTRDGKHIVLMQTSSDGSERYDELVVRRAVEGGNWVPMKKRREGGYEEITVEKWVQLCKKMYEFIGG